FSSSRRHTRSKRDWSSDVCSSDLCALYYLGADLPLTREHPLGARELRKAHRPASVQLLGGDADLGTKAELLTVRPGGGSVQGERGGIHVLLEVAQHLVVARGDALGVARAVGGDVLHRATHPV